MNVLFQKLSGEVRGGQNLCSKQNVEKHVFGKWDVSHYFAALKTGKQHLFNAFLIQIIVFLLRKERLPALGLILTQSWPTSPRAKCWQTYPPSPPKS